MTAIRIWGIDAFRREIVEFLEVSIPMVKVSMGGGRPNLND